MEQQINHLVQKAWAKFQETPKNHRLLIAIAGIPGSGKTTLAQVVTARLQSLLNATNPSPSSSFSEARFSAQSISMDGFHYTRAYLDTMPDPATAHARRGAAFTFDAPAFLSLVQSLRFPLPPSITSVDDFILAPSFDHRVKDPVPGDVRVPPTARIVVVEGNYLALDEPVWRDASALFDLVWFVDVPFEAARVRLRERHVRAGIVSSVEEGDRRAMENDLVNGREILEKRLPVTEIVKSIEDDEWVHG